MDRLKAFTKTASDDRRNDWMKMKIKNFSAGVLIVLWEIVVVLKFLVMKSFNNKLFAGSHLLPISASHYPKGDNLIRAKKFAERYLPREIIDVKNSDRNVELTELTLFEKAIVYKYTEDGYEDVNEILRSTNGAVCNEFGTLLCRILSKLPSYEGQVFRCAVLTGFELAQYYFAEKHGTNVVEHAFLSTSKSELTAGGFGKGIKFIIYSKTGKEIEKIAKFGKHSAPNEKEILFNSGTVFSVLDITKEDIINITIIMEEII